jgi:hypothetical protein
MNVVLVSPLEVNLRHSLNALKGRGTAYNNFMLQSSQCTC